MALRRTTAQLKDYLHLFMMPLATDKDIDDLLVYYPDDVKAGSPFNTGTENVLGKPSSRRKAEAHAG